jgi:CHAT domain
VELLKVYLSPINEADFKVSVNGSRVGQAETNSTLPFWEEGINWHISVIKSLEAIRFRLEDFQRSGEQDWMIQACILAEDRKAFHHYFLTNIGKALYQSLFPSGSKVEKVLQNAINLAQNNGTQLHIQLEIAADIIGSTRLPDYPWELMHDDRGFLTQHQVTFSRYITYDAAPPKLLSMKRVNVLLISSGASDPENGLEKLPQQEQLAVRTGLEIAEQEGHIRLVELKPPTLKTLRDYLSEHRNETAPHLIHFDGHGLFGKRCNHILDNGQRCGTLHKGVKINTCQRCHSSLPDSQGYLVFEDETGKPSYVSAKEMGTLLEQNSFTDDSNQVRGVAVVVLSACQSGLALTGTSVFNGVAQSLIAHRTPAVVAMQYSVSVAAATAFSEQFYRSLGQKNPLAMAVSQSREAMGVEGNQWYRPVLYVRWQDNEGGQLFAAPTPVIPTGVKFKPSVFIPSASLVILTTVAAFINLVKGDPGFAIVTLLVSCIAILLLTCGYIYFKQTSSSLVSGGKRPVYSKKMRRLALVGIFVVPILATTSFAGWQYYQSLPTKDIIILVADVKSPELADNGVTAMILQRLSSETEKYSDIKVKPLKKFISQQDGSAEELLT